MQTRHGNNGTVYQMFLRMLTPEGTLQSALPLLPQIAELGVEYIYLCPVFEQDGDMRREFWSNRQWTSGANNPRNPYRIRDYFKIDTEYGSDADLRAFVAECHRLGMKVLLDLVYLHCGPTAVQIDMDADFVLRDENGAVKPGTWHFPLNNFKSAGLREYLWKNMEYFVRDFDVDGYRCDVAGGIPLDFWEEGRRRMEAVKPDVYMISETHGTHAELAKAFDCAYGFGYQHGLRQVFTGERTVAQLREIIDEIHEQSGLGGVLRGIHNHDIDSDFPMGELLSDAMNDAALALSYLVDGVPFLYNGQEVCDHHKHQMFYTAGRGFGIDWSGALTERGRRRRELIKSLTALRRAEPELARGHFAWEECRAETADAQVLRFRRANRIEVTVSLDARPVTLDAGAEGKILTACGAVSANGKLTLAPFGWQAVKY